MSRKDRPPLADRIARAADAALAAQGDVSPIDVFEGIGWLYPTAAKEWRQGRIECIEEVMQVDPARIADAIHMLRSWAIEKELLRSEIDYVARTQRQTLRFTRSGNAEVERLFRTHWISPTLSERQRERLVEKASRPPELVVVMPLNQDWTCHRCGTGRSPTRGANSGGRKARGRTAAGCRGRQGRSVGQPLLFPRSTPSWSVTVGGNLVAR